MTAINKICIENFAISLEGAKGIDKVSLFLISSKNSRLKKMNLEGLSSEERAARLNTWGKEYRFVLVIEQGDMIFAHAHTKYAEQLQKGEGLSLGDRKMKVVALTEEQAARVSAIGVAFEEYILEEEADQTNGKKLEKYNRFPEEMKNLKSHVRQSLSKDQAETHFLVKQMVKMKFGDLISQCQKRFQEARQELKEQEKEEVKKEYLKREVIQRDIKKGEIHVQELKRQMKF